MSSLSREEELAELIAEQEKDAAYGDSIRYSRDVSLDLAVGEDGATLSDLVGVQDAALVQLTGGDDGGVRRIPRPQKWTRRAILSHIRKWAKEHGQPPRYCDWDRVNGRGIPSVHSVARTFGSFPEAVRAAGFEYQDGRRHPIQGTRRRKRIRGQKYTAHLTREQLAAAYVVYDRQGLGLPQIATQLWRKYGFRSADACERAIWRGFHSEGFHLRSRSEQWARLPQERRDEIIRRRAKAKSKLTPRQVKEIKASTERQVDLAARFGVSQTTVSRIQRGTSHLWMLEAA